MVKQEGPILSKRGVNLDERQRKVIIIRINKLYHENMSDEELYETTRGIWKIGKRREKASYAFSVYKGVIREVYSIIRWYPAGTLKYNTRVMREAILTVDAKTRWEFDGEIAEEWLRDKYIGKSVKQYLPWGASNPIIYINC